MALVVAAGRLPPAAAATDAPALVVQTLGGGSFDLGARRDHVVLIHFWATWCAPCREEMPVLDAFYLRNRDRGVEVIALSVDRARDLDEVRKAMQGLSFPAALVRGAKQNGFGAQNAIPVTFVVDGQGQVRSEMRPDTVPVTEANLAKIVEPLLPAR